MTDIKGLEPDPLETFKITAKDSNTITLDRPVPPGVAMDSFVMGYLSTLEVGDEVSFLHPKE